MSKCPFPLPAKINQHDVLVDAEDNVITNTIINLKFVKLAVNSHKKLVDSRLLYQKLLCYTQHTDDCALAPEDTNDNCDCGLDKLVTKIIKANKALAEAEEKEDG